MFGINKSIVNSFNPQSTIHNPQSKITKGVVLKYFFLALCFKIK
jgi:hypothetical protein